MREGRLRHHGRARMSARGALLVAAVLGALLESAGTASAATINVACADTAGLRRAIDAANAASGPTTIRLARGAQCAYVLKDAAQAGGPNAGGHDGLPIIHANVTVVSGPVPATLYGRLSRLVGATITRSRAAGTPPFRIFEVAKGGTLTLEGIAITNGRVENSNGGGGIFVDGRGTLNPGSGAPFTNLPGFVPYFPPLCEPPAGNLCPLEQPGRLTLMRSLVEGNVAKDGAGTEDATFGGGILNRGETTLIDSAVDRNTAIESRDNGPDQELAGEGGGLLNGNQLVLRRSSISGNSVLSTGRNLGAYGGAFGQFSIPDFRGPVSTLIEDSVIADNSVSGQIAEGAVMEGSGLITIRRTRITGNVATAHGNAADRPACEFNLSYCNAGSAFAAGALLNQGVLLIEDSVLEANRATAMGDDHPLVEGAALTNSGTFKRSQFNPFPGQATLTRTILRGNVAKATGPGAEVRGGAIANADHSQTSNGSSTIAGTPLTLADSLVIGNVAAAPIAHGGGIYNFGNEFAQNSDLSPRVQGVVILERSRVFGNSPNNCENQDATPIPGC